MREEERIIKEIRYPNTIASNEQNFYNTESGYAIKEIYKNGEMAGIKWFAIYKDNELVAEIKESVCDIYFK